ncbi:hypothetical protein C1Y26_00060 [Pseudomonas sp. MPR-R2A7]|nr:hypothetical protein C1Y23_02780 [Pseudomonas sp. GW460-12]PMX37695.1 hypothetical protein C1Y24_01015 [Pseudomonas sp. MPR-R2A4]PMX44023.1 hypothetical protein C1Y26_00060 [Pseudomonas sp. MPR-R2A7]PMX55394.1 hypothetical protein C1Y17_02925 [Pseudomonas sp. MPR-R2A6]PMX94129.1 hypothetical protein C1Y21_00060 [Pseudomonas sp. MPR-R2A3]PMY16981.1 hypothetical protein C1Y22_00060 [Pseudomonas sp. MPR-R2A5]PNA36970.1 hypothetical protein C1Y16_00060 [Pseudomonas sp. MPR-ANB1]PNA51145.1 hyp
MALEGSISEEELMAINWRLKNSKGISDTWLKYRPDDRCSHNIIEVIAMLYGSFAALVDSLRETDKLVRNIDDLMRVEYQDR